MIKNERGVTVLALVITVVLMTILISVGISYGGNSINQVKLQNFSYQLQQIQGRVDSIHEKMNMQENPSYVFAEGQTMGNDITDSIEAQETLTKLTGINYSGGVLDLYDENYYTSQGETMYRYFSKLDLERILDIKNPKLDVIINFKTREVISVKGQVYNEKTYYRLEEMKKKG